MEDLRLTDKGINTVNYVQPKLNHWKWSQVKVEGGNCVPVAMTAVIWKARYKHNFSSVVLFGFRDYSFPEQ